MLAFACEPDEGSEPEVGWKWAQTMASSCEITVITQSKNQSRIEAWQKQNPSKNLPIKFHYIQLGPALRWIKKKLPGGMYFYYALWQIKLRHEATRLLRKNSFDLIHHTTFASFRMPVFVSGRPVIWGPVGGAELAPLHLLRGYGTFAGRLRERIRNIATTLSASVIRFTEPTRRTGGVALASTPATADLLGRAGIKSWLTPAVGYEVAQRIPSLTSRPPRKISDPIRLLYVGRLHLLKGLHLALRALAELPKGNATLTIIGDGPELGRLRALARHLEIDSLVEFRGFVPRPKLADIFLHHDMLLAPSLYESGGLAVIEGFAHGLPAIVLDCGGHALSVDETCGIKVSPNQSQKEVVAGLANAIKKMAANPKLLDEFGLAATSKVEHNYSWSHKHDVMKKVYDSVLSSDTLPR
jgi:glycosyltransferase involved in cell wall biosynthesis